VIRGAGLCLLAVLAAGCGRPASPKAPKIAVSQAISGIATACGAAHMVLAGSGTAGDLRRLDAQALPYAARLVALERGDPSAVYLGTSMSTPLKSERTTMRQCRLTGTARRLG
jgi:hypothetical protein